MLYARGTCKAHLSEVEDERRERFPLRGVHVRVGLVSDEFVVDMGCSNSLCSVTPA